MNTAVQASELSKVIRVDEIPPKGREIAIEADADQLKALATRYGVAALGSVVAELRVRHRRGPGLIEVRGQIKANVTYDCVITLEQFSQAHEIEVSERLAQSVRGDQVNKGDFDAMIATGEDDRPEVLDGNDLDVGELVAELLALDLEPFPRKPGVSLDIPEEDQIPEFELKDNPFAALKDVKLPDEK